MSKKQKSSAIAILLALTIALMTAALPIATSQTPYTKKTYAVIGAMPNPVGVGQETLLWLGTTDQLQNPADGWTGLTITVTRPNNTTETLGPFRTDSTGSTGAVYVPIMVGSYYLQSNFPAQWYNTTVGGVRYNIMYEASVSKKLELVVQEEQLKYYPGSPLPTEYWTRPIDAQHREWAKVSGNWLEPVRFLAPYVPGNEDAPETAHILWAKPLTLGGLVGGEFGDHAFECGDAYEGLWGTTSPVIIGGTLYYNTYKFDGSNRVERQVAATDLRTGQELWRRTFFDNRTMEFGQVLYWDSWNYHGAFGYLWSVVGTTWHAFEAASGRWIYNITNVPTGTRIRGPSGEFLIYTLNSAAGWLTQWNSTRTVQPQTTGTQSDGSWIRANMGTSFNATVTGYDFNITIPRGLPGSINTVFYDDIVFGFFRGATVVRDIAIGDPPFYAWAVSLKPGQRGQILWNRTYPSPPGNITLTIGHVSAEDRVWTLWSKELRQHWGYSLDTGERIWGPTEPQEDLDIFGIRNRISYGKLFSTGYGGVVYCYDVKNGKRLWTYEASDPYTEILWSNNWPLYIAFSTDSKIYLFSTEHSVVDPKPRGAPFICLDVETGKEIWRINGGFRPAHWSGPPAIGDSIIALYSTYDNLIYSIGKGPSATTLTASPKVSVHGSSVLIEGRVTDESPGTKDHARTARFPNGVPAVSDEYMSEWMKYVYMQFERPKNVQGVSVTIDVLDGNGNYRNIGTAVSDASGFYSLQWTPDIEGKYTVIATFPGSKAYWPSYAETAFAVDPAPPQPAAPEPAPPNMTDTYVLAGIAVIVAAIAIVGVIIILVLRKRQ